MIKVNLLPQQEAAGRRGAAKGVAAPSSGSAIVALVLVLAYAGVIGIGFYVFNHLHQSKKALEAIEKQRADVKSKIDRLEAEYKELQTMKALYENQLEILNTLDPPDRLLWSEKLNLLPQLVPEGVYLTRLRVDEEVSEVETPESMRRRREWEQGDKRATRPSVTRKVLIKQTLTIDGVIYVEGADADGKRLALYIDFMQGLQHKEPIIPYTQKPKSFLDHFEGEIVIEPIIGGKVAGRDVSRFTIRLRTRSL